MTECAVFCEQCHEFLELNKWHPVESTSLGRVALISSADVVFSADAFPELAASFTNFLERHSAHAVCLYFSGGDYPWWPNEPDWFIWKRIIGPFYDPPTEQSDIDLPRNIIDDLGVTNWPDALAHYRATCPCVKHPEVLEAIFASFIAARP